MTFCEDCATRDNVEYRGKTKVLTKFECFCSCEVVEFAPDGQRCVKCGHLQKHAADPFDADAWDPLWMPQGQPIRRDQVLST